MASRYVALRVRVAWTDLDPAGIVYYPRFYAWMDAASHVLQQAMGLTREDVVYPSMLGFPVVSCGAEFLAPGHFEDTLEMRVFVTRVGRTSLGLRHEGWQINAERGGDDVLLMRGREDRVYIGRDEGGRLVPRALTPAMREVLADYLETPEP